MEAWELGCMLDLADSTALSALNRKESRGAHSREDFKARDDVQWLVHTLAYRATDDPYAPTVTYKLDTTKPVNMSLSDVDERFKPKERVY